MNQGIHMRKQAGISMMVVLGFLAMVALAGMVFTAMMKGGTNLGVTKQQLSSDVSTIRYQGASLESGFERLIGTNTVLPGNITFDGTANTGIFNGATGTTAVPIPPTTATSAKWAYVGGTGTTITLGGTNYYATYLLLTGNGFNGTSLNADLCRQINIALGDTTGTIPNTGTASSALAGKSLVTFNNQGAICAQTSDGYTYIHGVVANAS